MSNTNRDYLIICDVKNSTLVINRPIKFYITDKNTSNVFIKLVTQIEQDGSIYKYVEIENANNYEVTMRIIKPNGEVKSIIASRLEEGAIYQVDLQEDCKNIIGTYTCELLISTTVNGVQELNTSDMFIYKVEKSILCNVEITETEHTTTADLLNKVDAYNLKVAGVESAVTALGSQVGDIEGTVNTLSSHVEDTTSALGSKIEANKKDIDDMKGIKANVSTVTYSIRNTEGIINQILDVCKSYTDNFDKIVYGNQYTAWDSEVKTVDGKYQLDCSSFINLLIHGVTFNNSRYNGKNDNYGSPLFFQGINSYEYRLANQIAKFCVENGYAFTPNSDFSNIRAGDLVFYSWKGYDTNPGNYTQAQIDFHNNAFMKIDHIAMYLNQKNDNIYQTIQFEQYTPNFFYDVTPDYMSQCVLVARLPFANVENYDSKNIIVNGNKKKTCTNAIEVGKYYLNKSLEKGKMYSLSLNGKIDTENCYFIVQANGKTIHSDYGRNTTNGTVLFYFVYSQDEPATEITISIGSTNTSNTQRNGYINWCALNEGYRIISSKPQNTGSFNARSIPLTDYIKGKIVHGFAFTNNLVETETHLNISLNLPVNEDFASSPIVIGNLGFGITETQRIPCLLVSHNNTSCNGVLQVKWDGEVSIIKFDSAATWRHAIASGLIIKK